MELFPFLRALKSPFSCICKSHSMSNRYRDPNCSKTADVFQACAAWAAEARFTDEDVAQVPLFCSHVPPPAPSSSAPVHAATSQAKLSLFSSIDAPLPPSSRGLSLFTNALSDESRQRFRDGNARIILCHGERAHSM